MRHQNVVIGPAGADQSRSLVRSASRGRPGADDAATSCPTCGAHFSRDGRFCPFDRSPLVVTRGWDASAYQLLGGVIDGRYEVLSVIGEGGMGVVYEVRHTLLGRRFALKALRRELALDGDLAARFIREARTAAALSHPGLVEIIDFGRLDSDRVYFVMELVDGCSLAALLRQGPLPLPRALRIIRQLALALRAAHAAGVVHRDLKPDNILLTRADGGADRVKVVDFGLAKIAGSSRVTRAGMVFGTPHYMSPEQAAGQAVDHRADVYALGVIMYELFTGRLPFEADSYRGVLTKHLSATPTPPSALAPSSAGLGSLEQVVLRALAKRPEERYDNLAELLADLERRAPRAELATAAAPRSERAASGGVGETRFEARRAVVLVLVALAAALGVTFGDWLLRRGDRLDAPPGSATRRPGSGGAARTGSPSLSPTPGVMSHSRPAREPAREPARKPTAGPSGRAPKNAPPPPPSGARARSRTAPSGIIDPWQAAR